MLCSTIKIPGKWNKRQTKPTECQTSHFNSKIMHICAPRIRAGIPFIDTDPINEHKLKLEKKNNTTATKSIEMLVLTVDKIHQCIERHISYWLIANTTNIITFNLNFLNEFLFQLQIYSKRCVYVCKTI